ncbi:MAG: PAS domain-containing protein, partial [Erysipelotrichaceae bacterium]
GDKGKDLVLQTLGRVYVQVKDRFYEVQFRGEDPKEEEEKNRLMLERHQVIMDQASDIVFEWDIDKDTMEYSSNWKKQFGYDPIHTNISNIIPLC